MIYGGTITTPSNTAPSAPKRTPVIVTEGIVYHLKVVFPPGPSGLLHVQIFDSQYQVFPTTLGASFRGDNIKYDMDVLYAKSADPFRFEIVTWNLDDEYDHDVMVYMYMETAEQYKARYLPTMQTDALIAALGNQEAEKSIARQRRVQTFLEAVSGEKGAGVE